MDTLKLTLPDGSEKQVTAGTTGLDIAMSISPRLADAAVAVVIDGQQWDLKRALPGSGAFRILTAKDAESLEIVRHSSAHLMAQAIVQLFPGTKLAIGPVIENGFYYDIDSPHKFTPDDFAAIEAKMTELAGQKLSIDRTDIKRLEAIEKWGAQAEPYKVEMMQEWTDETVSYYTQGDFFDLCRGPHVPHTGFLKFVKLLSVAGAYWRGDEKRPMLQRIYATAFHDKKALEAHVTALEEAKKRDHRVIGRKLELFHLQDDMPGMVFWHPQGWALYRALQTYVREKIEAAGYVEVNTPSVASKVLWEKSGHWDKYQDNMFVTESEKRIYAIKPMNCPGHIQIFNQGLRSYRELPLRMAEFGSCVRNEPSGTLHGIMRVRAFVQDDAHIFCTPEQIGQEVADFCKLLKEMYADFGFNEVIVKFSTRPEKRVGTDESWDRVEKALADACEFAGLVTELNPGEGAFYGPKLEFTLKDCLGRHWQCGTIQVDPNLPERLGAQYVGEDGARHTPIMLHRAILGSLERFIGILIENYAGAFPVWLSPVQATILPVSEKFLDAARATASALRKAGLRVTVDEQNQKLGYKIREAEGQRLPFILVVGEKEAASGTVSVRQRGAGDLGAKTVAEFVEFVQAEAAAKR
ncbi:MAG: threonine--tRNA ligase [Fibrobacterota bacterium]|nr:MAG: threonine--tRNA ligase [Fibrobacterota bacterium]